MAITGLVSVPLLVHFLGYELFGGWVLILSVFGWLPLCQIGLSFSFDRYIAVFYASNNKKGQIQVTATGFYTLLAIASVLLITLLIVQKPVLNAIFSEGVYEPVFVRIITWMSLSLLVDPISIVFSAVLRGYGKFVLASSVNIGGRISFILLLAVFLFRHQGLESVVWATVLSSCIVATGYAIIGLSVLGFGAISPRNYSFAMLKELWSFGGKIAVSQAAMIVTQYLDKLLIGRFAGLVAVAAYDIGSKLVYFIRDIPMYVFGLITIKSSELFGRGAVEELPRYNLIMSKVIAYFSLFVSAFLIVFAPNILHLWVGDQVHSYSVWVFRILSLGAFIHVTSGVGTSIAKGIGILGPEMKTNIIATLLNISVSSALVIIWMPKAAVFGTMAAMIVGPIIFLLFIRRVFCLSILRFAQECYLLPITSALIGFIFMVGIDKLISPVIPDSRIGDCLVIVLSTGGAILCAGLFIYAVDRPMINLAKRYMQNSFSDIDRFVRSIF